MKPLLSNEDIEKLCSRWLPRLAQDWDVAWRIREIYEEDRRKKDELIQKLVDLIFHSPGCFHDVPGYKCSCLAGVALFLAKEHGYKPSEP